jgi:uncharacterized protein YukE
MNDSLVAAVESTRQPWTGAMLPDAIEGLVEAIESEGWVDDALAGTGLALTAVGTAMDPFSALFANGLGWAMEYFQPLRNALDAITGMPDVVLSHAQTWDNMAGELEGMSQDLQRHLVRDLPNWQGASATEYHDMMVNNVEALGGLGAAARAMAAATEGAGNLVRFTRDLVRGFIADLVARVIRIAAEAASVVAAPLVVWEVASFIFTWGGRVFTYASALVTSLQNLNKLLNG